MPSSMGSFLPRDGTHLSCIGRWVLYHWVTREDPEIFFPLIHWQVGEGVCACVSAEMCGHTYV